MSRLLREDKDPKPILENFDIVTPYGFTLTKYTDIGYSFKYKTKTNNTEYQGIIFNSDLAYALEILENKFRHKPNSIKFLEQKYSVTAIRKNTLYSTIH